MSSKLMKPPRLSIRSKNKSQNRIKGDFSKIKNPCRDRGFKNLNFMRNYSTTNFLVVEVFPCSILRI